MPKIPALPFVRAGVSAGLSANESFRQYQAAAQQAREQTGEEYTAGNRAAFLQLYSSVRSARSSVTAAMTAPKDVPLGGLTPVDVPSRLARGLHSWAALFVRPVGSSDVERLNYYIRHDQPLTPAEVEARARADWEASRQQEHGTAEGYVLEGVTFTGVENLQPTLGL